MKWDSWFGPTDEPENAVEAENYPICPYCGGIHIFLCPRISRIVYDNAGTEGVVSELEFDFEMSHQLWESVKWPK